MLTTTNLSPFLSFACLFPISAFCESPGRFIAGSRTSNLSMSIYDLGLGRRLFLSIFSRSSWFRSAFRWSWILSSLRRIPNRSTATAAVTALTPRTAAIRCRPTLPHGSKNYLAALYYLSILIHLTSFLDACRLISMFRPIGA